VWLQEVGEYGEKGMTKRAAVAIGPEFGTVGTELTREAAKEAVTFADLLVGDLKKTGRPIPVLDDSLHRSCPLVTGSVISTSRARPPRATRAPAP